MRKLMITTTIFALCSTWTPASMACGEVLFRTGKAMRYQDRAEHSEARILIVASAAELEDASRDRLYGGLRDAGHHVDVTESAGLGDALSAGEFNLVIAHQSELVDVISKLKASSEGLPQLIPVLEPGNQTLEPFKICLAEDAGLGQFLRAIHRVLR